MIWNIGIVLSAAQARDNDDYYAMVDSSSNPSASLVPTFVIPIKIG